jgi:hypothetical protein
MHGGKGKAPKSPQKKSGEGDATEDMDVEEETDKDYKRRLFSWVSLCLRRAGGSTNRDNYKIATCFDKRRQVISAFLKNLKSKRCSKCGA